MNKVLKKGEHEQFTLDKEHIESFKKIVDFKCSQPVSAFTQLWLPHSGDKEESDNGLGATILQTHNS